MSGREPRYLLKLVLPRDGGEAIELFADQPTPAQIRALAKRHGAAPGECRIFPISEDNRERVLASAKWSGWTHTLGRGRKQLRAAIGHIEAARFTLELADLREGTQLKLVKRSLHRLDEARLRALVEKLARAVPFAPCAACATETIWRTPRDAREPGLCRPCFMRRLPRYGREDRTRAAKELAARAESYKQRGLRYVARVWIHPKDAGSDWCVEEGFAKKPTRAQLVEIARRNGSAILDDVHVTRID